MDDAALISECADWIADQLEEENMWVDAGLIELVLQTERNDCSRDSPRATGQAIHDALTTAGVQGMPDAIDVRLIVSILEWEDDFLALAGRPRSW
ncbi:MAG: hypothetical protein ACR2PL_07040 [Dehalococcoidia bacterium]